MYPETPLLQRGQVTIHIGTCLKRCCTLRRGPTGWRAPSCVSVIRIATICRSDSWSHTARHSWRKRLQITENSCAVHVPWRRQPFFLVGSHLKRPRIMLRINAVTFRLCGQLILLQRAALLEQSAAKHTIRLAPHTNVHAQASIQSLSHDVGVLDVPLVHAALVRLDQSCCHIFVHHWHGSEPSRIHAVLCVCVLLCSTICCNTMLHHYTLQCHCHFPSVDHAYPLINDDVDLTLAPLDVATTFKVI